ALMQSERANGRAGASTAAGVRNFACKESAEARLDEGPCPHILRFFLAPDQSRAFGKRFHRSTQLRFVQRIQLLDSENGRVVYVFLFAVANQIEIDFAGAKNNAPDSRGVIGPGDSVRYDFVKLAGTEIDRA